MNNISYSARAVLDLLTVETTGEVKGVVTSVMNGGKSKALCTTPSEKSGIEALHYQVHSKYQRSCSGEARQDGQMNGPKIAKVRWQPVGPSETRSRSNPWLQNVHDLSTAGEAVLPTKWPKVLQPPSIRHLVSARLHLSNIRLLAAAVQRSFGATIRMQNP